MYVVFILTVPHSTFSRLKYIRRFLLPVSELLYYLDPLMFGLFGNKKAKKAAKEQERSNAFYEVENADESDDSDMDDEEYGRRMAVEIARRKAGSSASIPRSRPSSTTKGSNIPYQPPTPPPQSSNTSKSKSTVIEQAPTPAPARPAQTKGTVPTPPPTQSKAAPAASSTQSNKAPSTQAKGPAKAPAEVPAKVAAKVEAKVTAKVSVPTLTAQLPKTVVSAPIMPLPLASVAATPSVAALNKVATAPARCAPILPLAPTAVAAAIPAIATTASKPSQPVRPIGPIITIPAVLPPPAVDPSDSDSAKADTPTHVPSAARPYSATSAPAPHVPNAARPYSATSGPAAGQNVGVRTIVPASFMPDAKAIKQLVMMGFSAPAATLALYKTNNHGDQAGEFLLNHTEEEITYMLGVNASAPLRKTAK